MNFNLLVFPICFCAFDFHLFLFLWLRKKSEWKIKWISVWESSVFAYAKFFTFCFAWKCSRNCLSSHRNSNTSNVLQNAKYWKTTIWGESCEQFRENKNIAKYTVEIETILLSIRLKQNSFEIFIRIEMCFFRVVSKIVLLCKSTWIEVSVCLVCTVPAFLFLVGVGNRILSSKNNRNRIKKNWFPIIFDDFVVLLFFFSLNTCAMRSKLYGFVFD